MNKRQVREVIFGLGINSYNRFDAFLNIATKLKGRIYWYALRLSYCSSDNLYRLKENIKEAFNKNEPERASIMNFKERKFIDKMPDQCTIYRGMTTEEYNNCDYGISWSLKKEIAEFYAYTYLRNHSTAKSKMEVHSITINKQDIIALFIDREEFEIIYISNGNKCNCKTKTNKGR
jgi:hypothetical protein